MIQAEVVHVEAVKENKHLQVRSRHQVKKKKKKSFKGHTRIKKPTKPENHKELLNCNENKKWQKKKSSKQEVKDWRAVCMY